MKEWIKDILQILFYWVVALIIAPIISYLFVLYAIYSFIFLSKNI